MAYDECHIMMLEKYCHDSNITIKEVFIADCYSRSNFDRPAFIRLIAILNQERLIK